VQGRLLAMHDEVGLNWLLDSTIDLVWFTTEANNKSSLYSAVMSTGVISDYIGRRDASHGEGDQRHAQDSLDVLRYCVT